MGAFDHLLIYRKQLGDVLLLQPALAALATRGTVALATRPGFADMVSLMPGPVRIAPKWLPWAREVYCLQDSRGALTYALQTLARRRTLCLTRDTAPWWSRLLFSQVIVEPNRDHYRAERYYRMLGGDAAHFAPPRLNLPPAEWAPAGLPARYGVIHPTSAWPTKTYAPEHWIEALQGLGGELHWLVSGGNSAWEIEVASRIAAGLGARASCIAGRTSLRQYMALLAGAQLLLCVDGSASHLAAAFGRPALTLFGPTNPAHWHWPTPRTPRLWAADFTGQKKSPVDAIPPTAVHAATGKLLELSNA